MQKKLKILHKASALTLLAHEFTGSMTPFVFTYHLLKTQVHLEIQYVFYTCNPTFSITLTTVRKIHPLYLFTGLNLRRIKLSAFIFSPASNVISTAKDRKHPHYAKAHTTQYHVNSSPKVDAILAASGVLASPHSRSQQALERVTKIARKYSSIEKLANDEDIQNTKDRFRSRRRNRMDNQRDKRAGPEISVARKVRTPPTAAVQWVFSFMGQMKNSVNNQSSSARLAETLKEVS